MNSIVEIQDFELDPVVEKMYTKQNELQKFIRAWLEGRGTSLPFVRDCLMLGFELTFSPPYIHLTGCGDKDKFLKLIRIHRKHGHKPSIPSKGATEAMWFVNVTPELEIFVRFASTVCKRVQVGTKMEEVPIYETQCDEIVGDEVELLPAPAPAQLDDTVPF